MRENQGEATTPKKEARRVPPSALDESTRVLGPKTQHEGITPNLARRPPRAPCRTSGDDPPAPIGTMWWLAAVSAWISTKPQRLLDGVCWKVGRPRALVACCVSKNWTENICAFSGLESSQQPEVITAERPKLVRRFSPRCPRRSVALAC